MGKKSFQGREAFHRMNFLYQACHLLQATPQPARHSLSSYYGHILSGVAKKTVLRIDPSVKRTMCKGCHTLLVPGKSASIKVKMKNAGQLEKKCLKCQTVKRFNLKRDHNIWSDKAESVVQTFVCGNIIETADIASGHNSKDDASGDIAMPLQLDNNTVMSTATAVLPIQPVNT